MYNLCTQIHTLLWRLQLGLWIVRSEVLGVSGMGTKLWRHGPPGLMLSTPCLMDALGSVHIIHMEYFLRDGTFLKNVRKWGSHQAGPEFLHAEIKWTQQNSDYLLCHCGYPVTAAAREFVRRKIKLKLHISKVESNGNGSLRRWMS